MTKIFWSCHLFSQERFNLLKAALLVEIERLKEPYLDSNEAIQKAGQVFRDRSLARLEQFRDNLEYNVGVAESWIETATLPHPFREIEGEIPSMVAHQDHFAGDLREIPLQGMTREMGKIAETRGDDTSGFYAYVDLLETMDQETVYCLGE